MTTTDLHLANHPAMPAVGDRLEHRYEVLRVIAEGGSSVVYEVRDHLAGGRMAVKVLSPRKSNDPTFARRFRDEAALLRRLTHPNTVRVADVGETEAGSLYLVQELLEGEDLGKLIERKGGLDEGDTVHLLGQVLKALDEAHDLGIVHRDLKPANIMICQFAGDEDFVKVLDFGIAKQLEEGGRVTPGTSPNEVLFTPQYAAPELLNAGEIRPASDVYALGLIGIEMLTGRQVVTGATIWQIIAEQIGPAEIVLPPEVDGLVIAPVLKKAVAKRAEDRFRDAKAMLRGLENPMTVSTERSAFSAPPTPVSGAPDRASAEDDLPTWLDSDVQLGVPDSGAHAPVSESPGAVPWEAAADVPASRSTPPRPQSQSNAVESPGEDSDGPPRALSRESSKPRWATVPSPLQTEDSGPRAVTPFPKSPQDEDAPEERKASKASGSRSAAFEPAAHDVAAERAGEPAEGTTTNGRLVLVAAVALVVAGTWLAVSRLGSPGDEMTGADAAEVDAMGDNLSPRERCRAGEWELCVSLATGATSVEGRGLGLAEQNELLDLACGTGHYEPACRALAVQAERGFGVPATSARVAWEHLCDQGDVQSCWRAGYAYLELASAADTDASGPSSTAPVDPVDSFERAHALLELACEAEDPMGCAGLATILAEGWGAPADQTRAASLYEQACRADIVEACLRLGVLYLQGVDGQERPEDARRAFGRACEEGEASACANLAMMLQRGLGGEVDGPRAQRLYARACEADVWPGCAALANLYENGLGVETDLDRASELYQRACEGGEAVACARLAPLVESDDAEAAAEYRRLACERGYAPACAANE